ncbi:unnamed protein product, partial [Notodromas monacha]
MASVLNRCKETMQSPRMMHFIVEAKFDLLPEKMVQRVKEAYISEFKRFEKQRLDRNSTVRKRNCPAIEVIYSIESKMINDYQYDHIHFMFIVDFGNNRFGYQEIMSVINRTLGRLDFVVPIEHIDDFSYIGFKGAPKPQSSSEPESMTEAKPEPALEQEKSIEQSKPEPIIQVQEPEPKRRDKVSGKDVNRPQLQAMLEYIRAGDTLHVHSLDRLGRNTKDLIEIMDILKA